MLDSRIHPSQGSLRRTCLPLLDLLKPHFDILHILSNEQSFTHSMSIYNIQQVLPIRPDSIDLLFLGSFLDPFERVERDKNKNKRKKEATICMKIQ